MSAPNNKKAPISTNIVRLCFHANDKRKEHAMRGGIGGPLRLYRWQSLAVSLIAAVSLTLVACGGGGGGSATASANFTLSANSAAFSAVQGGTPPAPQSFTISVTGDTGAAISATFPSGQTQPRWLTVNVSGSGPTRTLTVTVTPGALVAGQTAANLVISATDAAGEVLHKEGFSVSLMVLAPPVLAVTPNALSFGGPDGRAALASVPVAFTLSTGNVAYPFAIGLSTTSGGQWLTVDHSSGTVGSAGATVNVGVNTAGLHGGTYAGQVSMRANVEGTQIVQTVNVSFNLEANRLVVTAAGVGLSKVAGRSVLTRTVQVLSNLGRNDVVWTAKSDSAWLSVTASGTTGGNLVLTANPSGLPQDQVQFATVTITSADPTVENQQSIRVGLYLSNTPPAAAALAVSATNLASSPVEPMVAISNGGTSVGFYNVYSGSLIRTLSGVAAAAGPVIFSEDGRTFFVFDTTNLRVNQVDSQSGTTIAAYNATPIPGETGGSAIAIMHPDGYAMLMTSAGRAYDLASGTQFIDSTFTWHSEPFSFATSPDQSLLAAQYGYTDRIVRSALNGGTLIIRSGVVVPQSGVVQNWSNGQSCFSTSGDRIYTASGAPYDFPATSVATSQVIQTLPGSSYPDAIQCVWNGLVVGGIDGYYDAADIFVYAGSTGVILGVLSSNGSSSAYRDLLSRGLAVSADGTILVSAWTGQSGQAGVYFQTLPAPPP